MINVIFFMYTKLHIKTIEFIIYEIQSYFYYTEKKGYIIIIRNSPSKDQKLSKRS